MESGRECIATDKRVQVSRVWMGVNGCERTKKEKLSMANQWAGHLGSATRLRASKYDVIREVRKSVTVLSIMYGMDVMMWNASEIEKRKVRQKRITRMALNASRFAVVEALRGDMG